MNRSYFLPIYKIINYEGTVLFNKKAADDGIKI